jgi:putative ABC transport system substrate-binding protein
VPLANELVGLKPDVLVGPSSQIALALKSATASIPIVTIAADPVGLGFVQSLSHPGGNITGPASFVPEQIVGKTIEKLRQMVPTASKIAILVNPDNPMHRLEAAEAVPKLSGS